MNHILNERISTVLTAKEAYELVLSALSGIHISRSKNKCRGYLLYFVLTKRLEITGKNKELRYNIMKDKLIPKRNDDIFMKKLRGDIKWSK